MTSLTRQRGYQAARVALLPKRRMKTAPKLIFLLKDADGFGASISDALQPNPNSILRRLDYSFDLSLERYGIKHYKASGDITHYVDDNGVPQHQTLSWKVKILREVTYFMVLKKVQKQN